VTTVETSSSGSTALIVIPAFNEARKIRQVIADLRDHVPEMDIAVIDDGSTDATAELAREAGAIVLRLPFNLGIGGALQTGYMYAAMHGYDVAVQFDGDGQHRADQIRELIAPVLAGLADMTIGSRMLGKGDYRFPLMRLMGSRLIGLITRMVTGRRISDPTSGFRANGRRAIAFFSRNYPQAYLDSAEITVWLLRQGMRVVEVPALMRTAEHSSIGSIRGVTHSMRVCLALLIDRIEKKFPETPPPPQAPAKEG
jgi:glycosyltransferase involved in cell wall biosynthesis